MIVLDASALVEFVVGADTRARKVRDLVRAERLSAPHGVDLECIAALRGLVKGGKLPEAEARRGLSLLGELPIRRYSHVLLADRIWQLRHDMWPYDASYAALAELLEVALVTVDKRFETVPGLQCSVRVITD